MSPLSSHNGITPQVQTEAPLPDTSVQATNGVVAKSLESLSGKSPRELNAAAKDEGKEESTVSVVWKLLDSNNGLKIRAYFKSYPKHLKLRDQEGNTPLMYVIRKKIFEGIYALKDLADKEDFDAENLKHKNYRALHFIVELKLAELLNFFLMRLIEQKASVNPVGSDQMTPFDLATSLIGIEKDERNKKELNGAFEYLRVVGGVSNRMRGGIHKMAKAPAKDEGKADVPMFGSDGLTPLMRHVKSNDTNGIQTYLLAASKEDLEAVNPNDGCTALHYSVENPFHCQIILHMMVACKANVNIIDKSGMTAFDRLSHLKPTPSNDRIAMMIKKGCSPNCPKPTEKPKKSVSIGDFCEQVQQMSLETIDQWIKKCIIRGKILQLKIIFEFRGEDLRQKHDRAEYLFDAIMHQPDIVIFHNLVKELPYLMDVSKGGKSPLHWAVETGHLEAIKYLIDCQPVNALDKGGRTPLDYTQAETIKDILKQAGGLPSSKLGQKEEHKKGVKKRYFQTHLHKAAISDDKDEMVRLAKMGDNLNQLDRRGKTALDYVKNDKMKVKLSTLGCKPGKELDTYKSWRKWRIKRTIRLWYEKVIKRSLTHGEIAKVSQDLRNRYGLKVSSAFIASYVRRKGWLNKAD